MQKRLYLVAALAAAFFLVLEAWAHDPNLGAIVEYCERIEKDPNDLEALKARGSTYRALEYFDSALLDLERAAVLEPGNPEVVAEIGMCHYHLGEWEKTTECLARSEELLLKAVESGAMERSVAAPIERELREYRFHNFMDLEQWEEALAESKKLETYLSGKLSFYCDVGNVLLALERPGEALPLFLKAVEASASFERYCVGAANCYLLMEKPGDALVLFEAWKAEDPESALPLMHQAYILKAYLKEEGAYRAPLERAEQILQGRIEGEEWPDIEDLLHLARVLQIGDRHQESWDILDELMEDYRGHWVVVHLQGMNAASLGRGREAQSFEKEARLYKRLNPGDWMQVYELMPPQKVDPAAVTDQVSETGPGSADGVVDAQPGTPAAGEEAAGGGGNSYPIVLILTALIGLTVLALLFRVFLRR